MKKNFGDCAWNINKHIVHIYFKLNKTHLRIQRIRIKILSRFNTFYILAYSFKVHYLQAN
jgi:hypothetical protein